MRHFSLILLLATVPAHACLWDRDTLAEEAKGKLDTVKAITGWFDRYPPRYYEMRIARVTRQLAANPKRLDLYDDAGVAANRLGRYDEALAWMAKKKAILDTLPADAPDTKLARYRYLANRGSFLGNRWATKNLDERRADHADLTAAIRDITEAIRLNPDAHFGREKYQLQFFQWLESSYARNAHETWGFLNPDSEPRFQLATNNLTGDELKKYQELQQGMIGLIELGSAWESVDVFVALRDTFQANGDSSLAFLAQCRVRELHNSAHGTLFPKHELLRDRWTSFVEPEQGLTAWYKRTREAAEGRKQAWQAYQQQRFAKDEHPDTDPGFWAQWKERPFPALLGQR